MALIKNRQSDGLLKQAMVLDMGDLDRQAQRMLANARAEAGRIVAQGREEAARLIAGADERGFAEGLQRGLTEGRESGRSEGRQEALAELSPQFKELIDKWKAALESWETQRSAMLHEAQQDVMTFAYALAKKVVHRLVQHDPTIIRDQLEHSLALLSQPTRIEVLVHPQDQDIAKVALPALLESIGRCEQSSIREDSSITPGGCIVKTAGGQVDSTIETQLQRIAEALIPPPTPKNGPQNGV